MNVLKKNIVGHIFFIVWWRTRGRVRFKVGFYLNLLVCICHQTDVSLLIVWTAALFTISVILVDRWTFLFLVSKMCFYFQLRTFCLHMSRFLTLEADALVAFLLPFLLKFCIFMFGRVLEPSFLCHHLFEFSWHKGHFIVCGSFRTIILAIRLSHMHL